MKFGPDHARRFKGSVYARTVSGIWMKSPSASQARNIGFGGRGNAQ
jgi:hypothetical protein